MHPLFVSLVLRGSTTLKHKLPEHFITECPTGTGRKPPHLETCPSGAAYPRFSDLGTPRPLQHLPGRSRRDNARFPTSQAILGRTPISFPARSRGALKDTTPVGLRAWSRGGAPALPPPALPAPSAARGAGRWRCYLSQADVAGDGQREGQRDARAVLRHGGPRAPRPRASSTEVPRAGGPGPRQPRYGSRRGQAARSARSGSAPPEGGGAAAPHGSALPQEGPREPVEVSACPRCAWGEAQRHGSAGTVPVQDRADAVARVISFLLINLCCAQVSSC